MANHALFDQGHAHWTCTKRSKTAHLAWTTLLNGNGNIRTIDSKNISIVPQELQQVFWARRAQRAFTAQCSDCVHRKDNPPGESDAILISSASATVSAFIMCFWLFSVCHSHRARRDSEHFAEPLYAVRSCALSDSFKNERHEQRSWFLKSSKMHDFDASPRSQKLIVLKIWKSSD